MRKPDDDELGCTGGLAVVSGLIAAQFLDAFTVMSLWGWYVTPFGIPALGMSHAYGLALLVAFLAKSPHIKPRDEDPVRTLVRDVVWTLFCLSIGYAVYRLGGVPHAR